MSITSALVLCGLIVVTSSIEVCLRAEASQLDPILQEFGNSERDLIDLQDLKQLVAIQSVSADPERQNEVLKAAGWLFQRMQQAGLEKVQILNTTGPQPIVYGEFVHPEDDKHGRKRPTVLIYGHYDVQPEDPVDSWTHPPFEVHHEEAECYIYGRGVDDDKGCLLQALHAFEVMKKDNVDLLPNIRFLFEGQEEVMSANLRQFLHDHKHMLLPADLILSADGRQVSDHEGGIVLAMRGVVSMEVEVTSASADVHSGRFGGSIPNAAVAAANIISQLHIPNTGAVAVPGFYEGVKALSEEEDKDIAALAFDEAAEKQELGIKAWHGEHPYTTLQRRWHRPTLEVVGMHGGFTGQGLKTIVPHKAVIKISCRLVPGQRPDDIFQKVAVHIKSIAPAHVTAAVKRMGGSADPWTSPRDNLGNQIAAAVIQEVTGRPPKYVRDGATIPALAEFQSVLGLQTTPFGWGLGENIHAPNERLKSSMWHKGHRAWALMLYKLGAMPLDGTATEAQSSSDQTAVTAEAAKGHVEL